MKGSRRLTTVFALVSVVIAPISATWPIVDLVSAQPPGYACPYGYYYATDGYCYPASQPAPAYSPPPVYEYAPPVYQPPAVYDGFGIGLGLGFLFGGERGRGAHDRRGDRDRGEKERGRH